MRVPTDVLVRTGSALLAAGLFGLGTSGGATTEEAEFLAQARTTMSTMMGAMQVKPAGSADADFVAMMAAHHRGAIAMAQAELHYGHNERLRRLAQEIIVTQQQEIAAMQLAIRQQPSVR